MSQVITARLSRTDAQPWGFRLQGGKDFGTPLVIQKVNTGSIADNAGLKAGDAVVRINQTDLYNLRHKDAQDCIVKAGPSFELVIQRGGATWKPSVTPIGSAAPSPIPGNYTPVTKTSLAANKQQIPPSPVRSIANKQYNTPVAMYSDETIAETLSSQAEVLAGGVLGVNFKKNEKVYNPEKSEVLKALQENDLEPEPAGSKFYWQQSHAIGGSATSAHSPRPLTPSYQNMGTYDDRIGTSLQQNTLAPAASHRPSLPVRQQQPIVKPSPVQAPYVQEKNVGASTISSALNNLSLNGNAPSNFSAPKPFSYAPPSAVPPMAGPKSPSSYPPPSQPTWAPPSAAAPAVPKPAGPVQEFIDIEKCNGKPREEKPREKKVEVYIPSESEEEFDPKELANIAKPPPSNFIWPPPSEEQKVPIAAPLYVAPPETQHVTAKPCTYRPLTKPQRLSVQNVRSVECQQIATNEIECLNVESNITATTSTSNASSESEYKMYQTQNNHYANMFEQTKEVDDEVEEINQNFTDLRKTPPPIELPKTIKRVEFVEPEPEYKAETFSSVFSNRKEAWMKLTESNTFTTTKEEQLQEAMVDATDDNPDNSEEDQSKVPENQEEEENDLEEEIQGIHAGPHEGTFYKLAPSNIPPPIPRGYQSDFQKALITTSEKPYQIFDIPATPEPKFPKMDMYEEAIQQIKSEVPQEEKPKKKEIPEFKIRTTKNKCEFPHEDQEPRKGSLMSAMMRTASPRPMEFVKSNAIEEVNLPDEIEAYFPPPISMTPNEPYGTIDSYRTKSPFVGALTTIPDRPYTPFGREIMSQLALELPKDTKKISFSNALHTAPEESYDPSSLEYEYDPTEYTAKVYEKITEEMDGEKVREDEEESNSSAFVYIGSSAGKQSFFPKMQPWSNEQVSENTYTNSMSRRESMVTHVSESRRCSEVKCDQRRRSSVAQVCDSRRCSEVQGKPISDLLKTKVSEEEEFDPEKPSPNAVYPKRTSAPSPFEGMQMKITNKMTSNLHKPDEIPNYQRKWFNLPTQNPPKTPEPEELRDNVPMAFHEWSKSVAGSERGSISGAEDKIAKYEALSKQEKPAQQEKPALYESFIQQERQVTMETTESKPPIPTENPKPSTEDYDDLEENDNFEETPSMFPTLVCPPSPGLFPTKGIRKNSLADLPQRQKVQFERQRDLRVELQQQQQKMMNKQKIRQQKELEMMSEKRSETKAQELIREEIQNDTRLSSYEQEQEYKRQLELERQQRQKEKELKEQQAREIEYQRQMEISRKNESKLREKREREFQLETMREMEYQKRREEQEEEQRRQQAERDAELKRQQEDMENEIRRQQEREKRMAEAREAQRLFEIRRREEADRELARLEAELREKREAELKQLEKEVREKREQREREIREAEEKIRRDQREAEAAEKEQKRLLEEAAKAQQERERILQRELKWRQKQDADRKQREEMELFNLEEEKRRSKTYESHTYQQQTVWPPSSKPPTPALTQPLQQTPIPIIRTDSETELCSSKFHFNPLDEDQKRFMAGIRPPSTCYSPPTEEKPFPSIPYYQQHLVFVETEPQHCGIFDPKAVSPVPNRSRSPAFGPPPNPLRAFVNKTRDPVLDDSGLYLCGERLLSPVWYDKQHKNIPAPVQRKIHAGGSTAGGSTAAGPPAKPDLAALNEAVRKHKQESGTKPPPPPPPMPNQKPVLRKKIEETTNGKDESTGIPKGSVGTPGALPKHGRTFTTTGPNRGQGVLTQPSSGRVPICGSCACQVRGPFITALGRTWCPNHFLCVNPSCKRELVDIGFVEEKGDLYCEYCFEQFLAPPCSKCNGKIKGDCLNAIGKKFHPECFKCTYCGKLFGNSPFFLEEGDAYCEADWNELFTTKCFSCGFPVEAGDRWVEALNNNYHSQCFNCTYCKKNLEGQSFFAKGGRPFCKAHAR